MKSVVVILFGVGEGGGVTPAFPTDKLYDSAPAVASPTVSNLAVGDPGEPQGSLKGRNNAGEVKPRLSTCAFVFHSKGVIMPGKLHSACRRVPWY